MAFTPMLEQYKDRNPADLDERIRLQQRDASSAHHQSGRQCRFG